MLRHHLSKISMLFFMNFSIILLFFTATTMANDQTKTVVTTGVAPVQGDNIDGARQSAIQDGLRQAVEQGVGMVMDATSIVQDDDLMEKIYSHTMGHVTEYTVLKEKQMPNGLFKVKLQAMVNTSDIKSALVKLGIIKPMMDYPRIMVLPFPDTINSGGTEIVEAGMIKHLTAKKYDLVDPAQSRKLYRDIKTLFADEGANAAAARIGLDHQAEIVILYGFKKLNGQFDGVMESVPVELRTYAASSPPLPKFSPQTMSVLSAWDNHKIKPHQMEPCRSRTRRAVNYPMASLPGGLTIRPTASPIISP